MVRSHNDHTCRLDIAFVEGVVATERDLEQLKEIRARAGTLVALGTCAVWGGLPAMQNEVPRETLQREVYQRRRRLPRLGRGAAGDPLRAVRVHAAGVPDRAARVPQGRQRGCSSGTRAELPLAPVCFECKTKENLCRVIYANEVCCGSMTRGGCGARCPSHGVACAGCRGPVEEPNYDANITMFADRGISWVEIARKMSHFSAPVWMTQGLEQEVRRGDKR